MVTERGIEVNPVKVQAVLDMQSPTNIRELQRLNGRIAALSRFISRSAERSLHFFRVLKKGTRFEWDGECQKAFSELKEHLAQLPQLTKPVVGDTLYLYFSVGENSLSSVLIKEEGAVAPPLTIAYTIDVARVEKLLKHKLSFKRL